VVDSTLTNRNLNEIVVSVKTRADIKPKTNSSKVEVLTA
jgi:hypothetical protein